MATGRFGGVPTVGCEICRSVFGRFWSILGSFWGRFGGVPTVGFEICRTVFGRALISMGRSGQLFSTSGQINALSGTRISVSGTFFFFFLSAAHDPVWGWLRRSRRSGHAGLRPVGSARTHRLAAAHLPSINKTVPSLTWAVSLHTGGRKPCCPRRLQHSPSDGCDQARAGSTAATWQDACRHMGAGSAVGDRSNLRPSGGHAGRIGAQRSCTVAQCTKSKNTNSRHDYEKI